MKRLLATMLVLAGTSNGGPKTNKSTRSPVIICMDKTIDGTAWGVEDSIVVEEAQWITTKMFVQVGFKLVWRSYGRSCPVGMPRPFIFNLGTNTPKTYFPGALGAAWPYEGIHIRIFYDRLRTATQPNKTQYLLAHVLAHEIAHVLQASNHHSDYGVMKERWDDKDFNRIKNNMPLTFAEFDVTLLHLGFERRKSRLVLRSSTSTGSTSDDLVIP